MAPLTPRRQFITRSLKTGVGLYIGSGLLTSCTGSRVAANVPNQYTTGFAQQPLPYAYNALNEAIDVQTMEIHYSKHAASYATNLNDAAKAEGIDTTKPLEEVLRRVSKFSSKVRNNGGGHYNHELFWKCMSPQNARADSVNKNNARMLSMRQLNSSIDSIKRVNAKIGDRVKIDVFSMIPVTHNIDSTWKQSKAPVRKKALEDLIPDSLKTTVHQRAQTKIESMRAATESSVLMYKDQARTLRQYEIEWHKKLTLSLACVVLFIIGAPLGSIIRKGGLGTPLVFAIAFFMVYYFSSTSGEKFAKEGSWGMIPGMWFSFLILIPVGIFLTYKAMNDSQVFNKDFYNRLLRKLPLLKREKA